MADARITIEGRIVTDPRFGSTPNGASVANLRVMAGRSRKNDDGTWENLSDTAYDIAFWREHSELVNMFNPEKGGSVIVSGTVTGIEKFEGDKGERLSVKVNGDGLRYFPKKTQQGGGFGGQQRGSYNQEHQPQQQQNDPWGNSNGQTAEPPF